MNRRLATLLLSAAVGAVTSSARATDIAPVSANNSTGLSPTNAFPIPPKAKPAPVPLSDEERARREERVRRQEEEINRAWTELSIEEKRRTLEWYREVRQLPPMEQKSIHERVERYLRMSPEEKQQLEKNFERWVQMTPAERERARLEFLRLRWEYERKWRKEHPNDPPPAFHLPPPVPAPPTKESQKVKPAEKPAPVEGDKPASAKTNG